jgi:hypothetical protein
MVAITSSSTRRRSRMSWARFLTFRLIVILGAIAGGIFLVQLKEQVLLGDHKIIVVEAPAYYKPGIRTRSSGPECRYYLAESAITNGGLGIFSAISIAHGKIALGVSHRRENFSYSPSLLTHSRQPLLLQRPHSL